MKIFVVSCVFPPELVVSARTSADVAIALMDHGHDVLVITNFPNRPAGRLYQGFKRSVYRNTHWKGLKVLRCFSTFSQRSNILSRFLENITFGLFSGLVALFLKKPDAVYANTWPIFAQGILSLVCRLRGIPVVLSIQDIYPESLIAQGRVSRSGFWMVGFLRKVDALIAGSASALIVISQRFREIYIHQRDIPSEKLHVIPNWGDELEPTEDSANAVRLQHHIPADAFLLVYGGNIGVAAGVDQVIQAFDQLVDAGNIYFLVAGEGSMLTSCQELAAKSANKRIVFHHPWQANETSKVLCAADLLVLPTLGEQSLVSVPSKLILYMLAARPVLAYALPLSETAAIIANSGAGWITAPGDMPQFAQHVREIAGMPLAERLRCGQAGRNFAVQNYSKFVNTKQVVNVIEKAGR
jgi:glycosyltransferase involved in cell wall biosynthesis